MLGLTKCVMGPVEQITFGLVAWQGAKIILPKLLGPTADYLGGGLKEVTKRGAENLQRVIGNAYRRLGDRINSPGQVPPRVAKLILQEAYLCEDPLAAEYFGGILASSRTKDGKGDRGLHLAGIVSRLSSYQIRAHYVLYQCFKHVYNGKRIPIDDFLRGGQTYSGHSIGVEWAVSIPLTAYTDAMGCRRDEGLTPYLNHALTGLRKEALIDEFVQWGKGEDSQVESDTDSKSSIVNAAPTSLGTELMLWAHGLTQPNHQFFFRSNEFPLLADVNLDLNNVVKFSGGKEWESDVWSNAGPGQSVSG